MSSSSKIVLLSVLLGIIGLAAAAEFVQVRQGGPLIRQHTTNAGELVSGAAVGQTFVSRKNNLSEVRVMFATYSNRENTEPVTFHLRESIASDTDLRTQTVLATAFGDNQFYNFSFEPIPDSKDKTYFFYVDSLTSTSGNAVTVDLNTQDLYHGGTAYLVRESDTLTADMWSRSGKQTVDVVFGLAYSVSLREAIIISARSNWQQFRAGWDDNKGDYQTWGILLIPAAIFILLLLWLRGDGETNADPSRKATIAILCGLTVAAVALRVWYADALPITNDEGNYLYDARTLRDFKLAGGDGYVKTPLVIVWIAVWQLLFGDTVMAGRFSSIVASSLMSLPLFFIGSLLWNKRAGLMTAAAWAILGAPVVFGIYVHTQPLALLFGVTGIALAWMAVRGWIGQKTLPDGRTVVQATRWLFIAGIFFGLGVASRKSILALGLAPLLIVAFESISVFQAIRRLMTIGLGFALVIFFFLGSAYLSYGQMGIQEALGLNSAEDGITAVDPAEADQVREYSLKGMTPFFRESLPIIFLSLLGWGFVGEALLRRGIGRLWQKPPRRITRLVSDHVVPKIWWLVPLAALWWGWQFFIEYEGSVWHDFAGFAVLWYIYAGFMVAAALWPRPVHERLAYERHDPRIVTKSTQPVLNAPTLASKIHRKASAPVIEKTHTLKQLIISVLLPVAWFGGMAFFYANWIKFHANYIIEFLPPLIAIAGTGAYIGLRRFSGRKAFAASHPALHTIQIAVAIIFMLVTTWSIAATGYVTYTSAHTGTFDQGSVQQAAKWARENIPLDQPIFTGAAVVPYLSGHHTALDIAHPRWYAYQFTREDTARLSTFLPPIETMLEEYRSAQWFLLERQTGFSFLMEYSEIEAGLEADWEQVHEVENGSNPLVFYRRVQPAVPSTP